MPEALSLFLTGLECGAIGAHARAFPSEYPQDFARRFLRRSVNYFSCLNRLLQTQRFPENPAALFTMLSEPLESVIHAVPEQLSTPLQELNLHQLGALLTLSETNGRYILGEDILELLRMIRVHKIRSAASPLTEYHGQKLFSEMASVETDEDYSYLRDFLSDPANAFFAIDAVFQTPRQSAFCQKAPSILSLAYVRHTAPDLTVYRCPVCRSMVRKIGENLFYCHGSNDCNRKLSHRLPIIETVESRDLWVLGAAATHNIYHPGQLERKIHSLLARAQQKSPSLQFTRWPEKDHWDFRVQFPDGSVWAIDAKNVRSPVWIIQDARHHYQQGFPEDRLFYIVPNDKGKRYLDTIRRELPCSKIQCVTLKQWETLLEGVTMS